MSITSIKRDWGVAPSGVRITSTDSIATIQTAGYMTSQADVIANLNGGVFTFVPGDLVMVSGSDGSEIFNFDGDDFATLVPNTGGGGGVTPTDIAENNFIKGNDTGSTNTYIFNGSDYPGTLSYGSFIILIGVSSTNTGASTLNVDGINTVSIVLPSGDPLSGGEMVAGGTYLFMFSQQFDFILMNSSVSAGGGGGVTEEQVQLISFNKAYAAFLAPNNYTMSTDAIIPITPAIPVLQFGQFFSVRFQSLNTGPITLIGDETGTPYSVKYRDNDLIAYDVTPSGIYLLQWNSEASRFDILNPSISGSPLYIQRGMANTGVDTGVADAYVVNLNPAVHLYTNNLEASFTPANDNVTTTPTLQVNGLGSKIITKSNGAVSAGDLATTMLAKCYYNEASDSFVLLTPAT